MNLAYLEYVKERISHNDPTKIFYIILVLIIGIWIIKFINRGLDRYLKRSTRIDISLHHFIKIATDVSLKVMLFLTIASMLGIPIASFIAAFGAAGLAVGLALRDSLSNLASGIMILISRPFGVTDYIKVQDCEGRVKEIGLLYTALNTSDNKRIIIPNNTLFNSKVINYSYEKIRRVDFTIGVSYDSDIKKVKDILTYIANNHPLVLNEPKFILGLDEFASSSINFSYKLWCKNEDYYNVFYDVNEKIKYEFDKYNIEIPYDKLDVNINK